VAFEDLALTVEAGLQQSLRRSLPKSENTMIQHFTCRSLLMLLTAVMISVQSAAMGFAVRCGRTTVCCEKTDSCCHSGDRSCCAVTGKCGGYRATVVRCCTDCLCGEHEPSPAVPNESQVSDDLRQRLPHDPVWTGFLPSMTQSCRRASVERTCLSAAKAGVNAMLCVWQT